MRTERVRGVLEGRIERGTLPGAVFAVARRGQLDIESLGTLALDSDQPMRSDTIFRISSMTKPIVAAATMILVEECRLRLDDPVDELLPELADRRVLTSLEAPLDDTVPANRPLTLRDLLTYRMGFGIVLAAPGTYPIQQAMDDLRLAQGPPQPDVPPPPDEWIRNLGELPLMLQPGEAWLYSTPADVLGVLVARASGHDLEAFLRERIFDPLGMRDTAFSVPADKRDRLATSYLPDAATGRMDVSDAPDGQWSHPPAFPSGAGGLVSTVEDYLAFAQMMLDKGTFDGHRILSSRTVETVTTNQITPEQRDGPHRPIIENRGWGLGMSIIVERDEISSSIGAYGWDGGMGTSWRNDPANDLAGILLTQLGWSTPDAFALPRDFWTSTYVALDD
jgi:CubicO group peptidase (beta-lactamase class C family)